MKVYMSFLVAAILLVVTKMDAQEFKGKAIYKSHRKVDLKMDDNDKNSEMKKQIQEQLRKQFQQEYTLTFDQYQSLYKKNEKLAAPAPASNGIQITISEGSDLLYKNIKEKRFVNQTEIYGKQFLIKDSLITKSWTLVNETKNIGIYTCFKATFSETYETQTITEEGKLDKVAKDRLTTAWYTPQIPINNGPEDFNGLPGLILEINDGELTLVCTRVVMNPDESIDIKEPKKGKEVTQAKFDEIMDKKTEEQMENMRSRRGDGEKVMIKIGG
ncbi:GLPGLI family protein [Psychroserpens ponticola]|uniref:GLPGLI family protein n=1 Tax=Psychroserpens ponticola TaxID=2932268 RepID=A0ABY7RYC3_9FLAO|nr:GLPGLI family protein [Psychroserpens ponticola]WCO02124.1 GLPGLI family protein [Psychroserpens ponticola]